MLLRFALPLSVAVLVLFPGPAPAAPVEPLPGAFLSGSIHFPRREGMTLKVDNLDPTRATASLGFDGRCRGGGLGEFWAAFVPAHETVKIRKGRFSAHLTGVTRNVGGIKGRDGAFQWKLSGRFTDPDEATAVISGTARIRMGGHVVSRCRIAGRPSVRLTMGD